MQHASMQAMRTKQRLCNGSAVRVGYRPRGWS